MVLVLSAVVVAGVMVYYQTAQTNNQLDQASSQMMHIVSEINGLYAGAKKDDKGIYNNLKAATLLAAIPDLKPIQLGTPIYIQTPLPNIVMEAFGLDYDPVTHQAGSGPKNNYFLTLGSGKLNVDLVGLCYKFFALNFGSQAVAYLVDDGSGGANSAEFADASAPFADKVKLCGKLKGGTDQAGFGIVFN